MNKMTNEIINIGNRNIGIAEYGELDGFPVLYFHGFPGSRLDGELIGFNDIAKELNVKIICIDRPGIGRSDFQPNRRLKDWPKDVLEIADKLGIKSFSVLGLSGGGPYALQCAYSIPERIKSVAVVSSMGPYNIPESKQGMAFYIPKKFPPIRKFLAWGMKYSAEKSPEKLLQNVMKTLPEEDKKFLSKSEKSQALIASIKECFKQGIKGYLNDASIYKQDWLFALSEIKSKVFLWHGESDLNVSIEVAKKLGYQIQNCEARYISGEGHFSLINNYLKEVLNKII